VYVVSLLLLLLYLLRIEQETYVNRTLDIYFSVYMITENGGLLLPACPAVLFTLL